MTQNNEKIDVVAMLTDFLRIFRKMWIQVIALALIFAVAMTIHANVSYRAYYTAYSSFTVTIRDDQSEDSLTAYYDNTAAEQMAETFPYILTSGVLQRMVAKDMGEAVSGSIQANVVESTNLFTLSVTDTDPERAQKTLKSVIKNYPKVSEAIVGKLNMKVLDESGVPTSPDNPKNLLRDAAKGAVTGTGIGLAWVLLVTLLRRTIRSEEDCQKYVNQRCLGSVPYVRFKERSDGTKRHLNIVNKSVNKDFKEAIRNVRNKVERHTHDGSMKRVVLTSALSGEGKSTIAVNLALSLAQEGKRVTLIDCDLRNPSDAAILGIKVDKGLVDYINEDCKFEDFAIDFAEMSKGKENFPLVFLPGGKPVADASNLLGSAKMKEVIDTVSKKSDYVILDSAPVGLLTDASVLSQYADCAMFIVKKDFAKTEHIMSGIEHLARSGIRVIGCVLNGD